MSAPAPPVFKIAPGIQSYDWGKKGSSSLAAQLAEESVPDFQVDENKPYAEVCRPLTLLSGDSSVLRPVSVRVLDERTCCDPCVPRCDPWPA